MKQQAGQQQKKQQHKKKQQKQALLPILKEFSQLMINDPDQQFSYPYLDQFLKKYEKVMSSQITNHELSNDIAFQLRDIKFKMAWDEDELFASNKQIHQNFRRGLTFINYGNEWVIIRRGQKKFFDLYFNDFQGKGDEFCNALHNYTSKAAFDLAKENKSVEIYVTEKANGENCQISYCKEIDCWSVSSKNKTIVLRNENDIYSQTYQNNCYNVAQKVAQEWFNIIKNKQDKIEEIKQLLSNYTFVGEYCGHKEHQHLIRYEHITIKFFSLVKKIGIETCLTPKFAMKTFDKLGLERVKFKCILTQGEDDLKEKLMMLEKEISSKSIMDEGEGCVLYFCNGKTNECLSLAKLKTIEYRIARKIREKLKSFISHNATKENIINKFIHECEMFPYFNDPEFQKQYYINLCDKMLSFGVYINAEVKNSDLIKKVFKQTRQKYLDFLDLIKKDKDYNFILQYYINMKDEEPEKQVIDADDQDDQDLLD